MSKILVVEDDQFIAKVYQTKLRKEGFEVIWADNGFEALGILETDKPDLIVLDLVMPKLDGFGFLERIKQNPYQKEIPVFVVSNLSQDEDKKRVMSAGADQFINKSQTSLAEIISLIKETLQS